MALIVHSIAPTPCQLPTAWLSPWCHRMHFQVVPILALAPMVTVVARTPTQCLLYLEFLTMAEILFIAISVQCPLPSPTRCLSTPQTLKMLVVVPVAPHLMLSEPVRSHLTRPWSAMLILQIHRMECSVVVVGFVVMGFVVMEWVVVMAIDVMMVIDVVMECNVAIEGNVAVECVVALGIIVAVIIIVVIVGNVLMLSMVESVATLHALY